MPTEQQLTDLVAELHDRLKTTRHVEDAPTYFEVATLLCWMFFQQQRVEIAVLETGLGGRLDCTNVCRPLLTVITSIGLDHTAILGDTVEQIAAEKAGILKPNIPLLTWVHQPAVTNVIQQKADSLNCDVFLRDRELFVERLPTEEQISNQRSQFLRTSSPWGRHERLRLPLLGRHQAGNAALAVAAADFLAIHDHRITPQAIDRGVAATIWPLRFETFDLQPTVILDAAHNPDSIAAFARTVQELYSGRDAVLIFASSKDKDAAAMLTELLPCFRRIVLTEFQTNPRATAISQLLKICSGLQENLNGLPPDASAAVCRSPQEALEIARQLAGSDGLICGTGSVFLAAELRQLIQSEQQV